LRLLPSRRRRRSGWRPGVMLWRPLLSKCSYSHYWVSVLMYMYYKHQWQRNNPSLEYQVILQDSYAILYDFMYICTIKTLYPWNITYRIIS
jgi:hypothetical protein